MTSHRAWAFVVVLVSAVLWAGCDRSHVASPPDAPLARSTAKPTPATAKPAASSASSTPSPTPTAVANPDEGSVEIRATILEDAKMGRPGPGVLSLAADPRFTLRLRIDRVDPQGSDDFAIGEELVLGIHSPSRTFPGGAAKGQNVTLRIQWRKPEGEPRGYYQVERVREAPGP